jgi:excisionase family DNA binding protein
MSGSNDFSRPLETTLPATSGQGRTTIPQWLSLSEVAGILGVHPSTVRNWSDRGTLPAHRTHGGHRRYLRSEINLWLLSQQADESADVNLIVQSTLRSTRFHVTEGRLAMEGWYNKMDEPAREQYRASGRSLLQGVINYLNSETGTISTDAETLGYEYASRGHRHGLNNVEAVHAFLFFRNVLFEAMLAAYEAAAIREPHAWSNLFRKVNAFMDQILMTLMETYEAYQRGNR